MDGLVEAIIRLWNEAENPLYIVQKLGIKDENGDFDTEMVEMIIDDPDNYKRGG